jgi:hypothetical protein
MKRIGKIGESCRRLHQISVARPVLPSKRIFTDRFIVKDYIQRTRWSSQSYSRSLRTSLPGSTASNALFTSIVRKDVFEPLSRASSMSCVRHVVRSTDDCSGRAPNCWFPTIRSEIASQAILRATSLSSPLPSTDRRAIGLYDLGDVRSVLFGLGITV